MTISRARSSIFVGLFSEKISNAKKLATQISEELKEAIELAKVDELESQLLEILSFLRNVEADLNGTDQLLPDDKGKLVQDLNSVYLLVEDLLK